MNSLINQQEVNRLIDGVSAMGMVHKSPVREYEQHKEQNFFSLTGQVRVGVSVDDYGEYCVHITYPYKDGFDVYVFDGFIASFGFREGYELHDLMVFLKNKVEEFEKGVKICYNNKR